jgi:hypothetical protein
MLLSEAREQICGLLSISFADDVSVGLNALFTTTDIDNAINAAALRIWDMFPWVMAEGYDTTTTVAGQENYDYPINFIPNSIFMLQVNDSGGIYRTYTRTKWGDFNRYREDNEEGDERYYSNYGGDYYVNKYAWDNTAGRTIKIWGKKRFTRLAAAADKLPFSPDSDNYENSGNEAILRMAYSDILASEKKREPAKAKEEEARAMRMLQLLIDVENTGKGQDQPIDTPLFDVGQII